MNDRVVGIARRMRAGRAAPGSTPDPSPPLGAFHTQVSRSRGDKRVEHIRPTCPLRLGQVAGRVHEFPKPRIGHCMGVDGERCYSDTADRCLAVRENLGAARSYNYHPAGNTYGARWRPMVNMQGGQGLDRSDAGSSQLDAAASSGGLDAPIPRQDPAISPRSPPKRTRIR